MDFRRAWLAGAAGLIAVTLGAGVAGAHVPIGRSGGPRPNGGSGTQSIQSIDNLRRIDVNSLNMFVTNYGSFSWDLTSGNSGLIFPKGTNKTALFASGIWLGAKVGGEVRTVVAEYSMEYQPGIILPGGAPDDPRKTDYKTYKVVRYSGDPSDTSHIEREANEQAVEDPLVHHSWSEYMAGAAPYGAPTRTYRLPVTETSDPSDSADIEGPDVLGDMMLWCVFNDADPSAHTNDAGGSAPLGVEIHQKTFAFNRQGPLGNIAFVEYLIINKGTNQLDEMYVSVWSDPDLGGAADDLVGCDTTLSLGYTYNATNNDNVYGDAPPAVGFDFFLGPENQLGLALPLTSFNKYINGTDPASTDETYNYMTGILPDGSPLIDPTTGDETHFFHPGDPINRTGWLDSNPADRRHLLSSGPFSMAPGDTQRIVTSVIVGQGNDRLSSIAALKFYDDFAQLAFDQTFLLPDPPAQPKVTVDENHGAVRLCWDSASRDAYEEPGYFFEGYNVYQGETVAGPWRRIATYDEIDSITVVRDTTFDINTGQTINDYPFAYGTDAGIQYCVTIDQDRVRGGSLKDGTEYYFAVTSYSVADTSLGSDTPKLAVVENAQQVIRVIPQRPASGTDEETATATVEQSRIDSNLPPATDIVEVVVVDPDSVTGETYVVTFSPLPDTVYVGGIPVTIGWNFIRVTGPGAPDTLLKDQYNKTGDLDYRTLITEGLQVRVLGSYEIEFQGIVFVIADATHRRAIEGVNFGLGTFNGGGDLGANFFGSTIDPVTFPAHMDSMTSVEMRFNGSQKAYRFVRQQLPDGTAPYAPSVGGGRGYFQHGFVDVPFQVWDVANNVQLDAAVLEKEAVLDGSGTLAPPAQQPATWDSTWAPDASSDGGREYVFVYRRPYSDTPKAELEVDASVFDGVAPVLYTIAPKLRASTDIVDPDDFINFIWANPATPNDVYTITTAPLVRSNSALASTGLKAIRVVPNPYYNRSRYELSQFNRIVRFINMPELATVRIFNLSGELIRTLHKDDPTTSVFEWDLLTDRQLPVASGVYIYHVDAPGAGSTFGRMVVFMAKERLNNF